MQPHRRTVGRPGAGEHRRGGPPAQDMAADRRTGATVRGKTVGDDTSRVYYSGDLSQWRANDWSRTHNRRQVVSGRSEGVHPHRCAAARADHTRRADTGPGNALNHPSTCRPRRRPPDRSSRAARASRCRGSYTEFPDSVTTSATTPSRLSRTVNGNRPGHLLSLPVLRLQARQEMPPSEPRPTKKNLPPRRQSECRRPRRSERRRVWPGAG